MGQTLERFTSEHRHVVALIDAALRELDESLERSALDALGATLREHLRFEEQTIFPAVERLVGEPDFHLTATLRREHVALRVLLDEVERERHRDNRPGAIGNLRELAAALVAHERKERHVLYQMAERALGPERAAVVATRR